ncbi:hypothetical protein HN873_023879 [Arachis hypogaea]
MIRERPGLGSLAASCLHGLFINRVFTWGNVTLELIDASVSLRGLTCFDLSYSHFSDELLSVVAEEGLSLRELSLRGCQGYGYGGISFFFLRKCNNMQYFDLQLSRFLDDRCVIELSLPLGSLNIVKLSENEKLTDLSLFAIMQNCPLITEIKMERTNVGKKKVKENCLVVNSNVKFFYLAHNSSLNDGSVKMIASVCPNMEMIDLRCCESVLEGALKVLRK